MNFVTWTKSSRNMTEANDVLNSDCSRLLKSRLALDHCWFLTGQQHLLVFPSVHVSRSIKTLNLDCGVEGRREVEVERHHHVSVPAWLE